MLEHLITSKTRLRMLLKFFLHPENSAYLRELANEFGDSTNAVRVELNRLAEAKLLRKEEAGNRIVYQANQDHAVFPSLKKLVRQSVQWDDLYAAAKRIGAEAIFLRESEKLKTFSYLLVHPSNTYSCFHRVEEKDHSLDLLVISEDELESVKAESQSCFLIWKDNERHA
ncbi:winged helix-turn-helix domain-containing protein [Alteribacillus sp. JSM 102045]|uniref:winged helix-turn-helix domain-containing protein n=1 Tax=Alteribacillus sp. JSM 102045 TaxID=1562101 RepID=UPI0035C23CA9